MDEDSPAETAGLKQGDKIIAVNGDNILEATHQSVVGKIKSDPGAVRLLVLDPPAEEYYRTRNIVVNDDMPHVLLLTSPDSKPGGFMLCMPHVLLLTLQGCPQAIAHSDCTIYSNKVRYLLFQNYRRITVI